MCFAGRCVPNMVTTRASFVVQKSGIKLWLKRLGWLVLIWTVSVLALAIVAYLMRLFMRLIGLS